MPTAICVLNRKSRDGQTVRQWPRVSDLLAARGVTSLLIDLTDGDFAANLRAAIAATPDLRVVVSLGGDGTHMAVLNALLAGADGASADALPPLAVCPFGTGNDVAKSLGLQVGPQHLPATVDTMVDGELATWDLGAWDGHVFADALCVGLDAEVLRRREQLMVDLKTRQRLNALLRGYPLYLLAAARVGLQPPHWQVRVLADGEPWYDGPMTNLVINNCRVHAGEFDVTPDARPDDGLLDAVLLPGVPANLLRYLLGFRHLPETVKRSDPTPDWLRPHRRQARHFEIELGEPAPVQVDGEYFPPTRRLDVGIRPAAIRVRKPLVRR